MNIEQLISETLEYLEERTDWEAVDLHEAIPDRMYTLTVHGPALVLRQEDGQEISLTKQDPASLLSHLSYEVEKTLDLDEAAELHKRRVGCQRVFNKFYLTKGVARCGSVITPKEETYAFIFDNKDGKRNKWVGPEHANQPVIALMHCDLRGERSKLVFFVGTQGTGGNANRWTFKKQKG